MSEPLRWGILTTGNIARQFADGLRGSQRGRAVAVGSRKPEPARQFADTYSVEQAYGSYDELLADPQVEAVYNALPNSMHHEWAIKALRAGKHVLCEKPLARDAAESEEMFDAAERAGLVITEAFMYRSHPLTHAVMDQLRAGAIGELMLIRTSFCFCLRQVEGNIRFSRELAGGALMDIGCYCVSFSRYFAGAEPDAVHVTARMHETGVDYIAVGTLHFPTGLLASFTCGMALHADNTAALCGNGGSIELPVPWKPPVEGAQYVLKRSIPPRQDQPRSLTAPPPETFAVDAGKPLYALEADDFAAAVRDGKPPRVSRQDTIGNMKVIDELRRQIGLMFPS